MQYFVYLSEVFKKSAIDELKKLDSKFEIAKDYHEVLIIESEFNDLDRRIIRINPIFMYNLLPISAVSRVKEDNYLESVYSVLKNLPTNKKIKTMIQCFNINSKRGYSAKDIEVYVGEKLEHEGYNIDIKAPDRVGYVIILDMTCYFGSMDVKDMFRIHVDPKRFYKNKFQKKVSRAELKLEEALDEFGLNLKGGVAIDIGAAPGGWSLVLSRRKIKVIAIDPGNLDIEALDEEKLKVKQIDSKTTSSDLESNHILHLKSVFESVVETPIPVSNVDLIVVDMNTVPEVAVNALNKFLPLLSRNAKLIMTVKCVTRNVPKYIEQAKTGLAENFNVESIRYLPANRMEVTLYAIRK